MAPAEVFPAQGLEASPDRAWEQVSERLFHFPLASSSQVDVGKL
jgi:hypothetical protein